MNKSLIALAFGTLGLGMAEFVTMGILPELSESMGITNAEAGHFISAYALGVCVGAPLCSLIAGAQPLKRILLCLMAVIALGNLSSALSDNYWMLMLTRFIAGLPHGAFFGVGSIVAEKLAERGKEARAVSTMLIGITFANLAGVPAGIFLGQLFSWHASYAMTGFWGVVTFLFICKWVPALPAMPSEGFKGQFRFLKSAAPWLILAVTLMANDAFFCLYSYIAPLFINVSGFAPSSVSLLMMLTGAGMCLGNMICGKLSDQYTPGRVAAMTLAIMCASLAGLFLWSGNPWVAAILSFICGACLFGIGLAEQVLILRHARGGEMIGVAGIQIAFNLGNAIGAYCGGIPLRMGYPEQYTTIPALMFAIPGLFLIVLFRRKYETSRTRPGGSMLYRFGWFRTVRLRSLIIKRKYRRSQKRRR